MYASYILKMCCISQYFVPDVIPGIWQSIIMKKKSIDLNWIGKAAQIVFKAKQSHMFRAKMPYFL